MTSTSLFALPETPRPAPWGTAASIGLHAGLAALLILVSPLKTLVAPPPTPIAVEIVTPAEFAARQPVEPPPVLAAPAPSAHTAPTAPSGPVSTPISPAAPDAPAEPGMIAATEFYAANMLHEPGMARIRQTLTTLVDSERVVQLCNIEGLEQIRRAAPAFAPDTLVPYAMADMAATGLTLSAAGGAFRSRRKWYGIAFYCTAAADYSGVTAFAFQLGDAIPPALWEEHNLTAAEDEAD